MRWSTILIACASVMSLLLLIRVFLARVLLTGTRMRSRVLPRWVLLRVRRLEQLLVLSLGILLLSTKVIQL
jgi:hypothetical protein